jgi:hypothetical protein
MSADDDLFTFMCGKQQQTDQQQHHHQPPPPLGAALPPSDDEGEQCDELNEALLSGLPSDVNDSRPQRCLRADNHSNLPRRATIVIGIVLLDESDIFISNMFRR